MSRFAKLAEDLEQTRDEIRLRVHLGSNDIQDEWQQLEKSWQTFEREAELDRSAKDVAGTDLHPSPLKVMRDDPGQIVPDF